MSAVQISPFRPSPSHSATESYSFGFSVNICSWSTLAGRHFSPGPKPVSAALLITNPQSYCHGNECKFFGLFLVIKITEDVTISLNEYCQMWYVRSMSNWSTIVNVHIFCKQAIHSYNREEIQPTNYLITLRAI